MSSNEETPCAQEHLLPTNVANMRIGSANNELTPAKRKYIIEMRKTMCGENICTKDGSLNLKYFNVKRGHYWSKKENEKLIEGVIKFGPTSHKQIKEDFLPDWTETEIRLRTCKLLRFYNLQDYENTKFYSAEQIADEAKRNKETATEEKKNIGGIYYNAP
mmetsp:Transcript_67908/g.94036  ORF Transcript_67908/g.94036 Transcript_67908/m.94036 type:complete len:161 (-) Transcript_67908:124-606(-)